MLRFFKKFKALPKLESGQLLFLGSILKRKGIEELPFPKQVATRSLFLSADLEIIIHQLRFFAYRLRQ